MSSVGPLLFETMVRLQGNGQSPDEPRLDGLDVEHGRGPAATTQGPISPRGSRVSILFTWRSEASFKAWLQSMHERKKKLLI